ncbi:MAG TPA: hypothetical protein VK483_17655 [Chitinophagaceae bacterium]|nr:hypothetical protein [Chitinophagaceae bacterium]
MEIGILIILFPELYILYRFILTYNQNRRKKIIPKKILWLNAAFIMVILVLKYMVLIWHIEFIAYYHEDLFWESSIHNLFVTIENGLFVFGMFLVGQVVFEIIYRRKFKELNDPTEQQVLKDQVRATLQEMEDRSQATKLN